VECRWGEVEDEELDPNSSLFFFHFFFYHAFIVFRHKKLCAVLAREKTKPINQKGNTKATILSCPIQNVKNT